MEKSNINLLCELAEPYNIKIREVPPEECGLMIGSQKLSPEEAIEILLNAFKKVKI